MRAIAIALIAVAAMGAAAQEQPDTVVCVRDASELSVARTPDGLKVEIKGSATNPGFRYEYIMENTADSTSDGGWTLNLPFLNDRTPERKRRASFNFDIELYAGSSIPTGATPMTASFEIGISRILNGRIDFGKGFCFNAGAGIGYVQYAVGHGMRFAADRQHLLLAPRDAATTDNSSRLRFFRVHFPLTFTQMLSQKFYITAGAWLNLNTTARASSGATTGSVRTTESYKDLHQRILTTDIILAAGFRGTCGLYARYSPSTLFRDSWGPQFKSVNVGLIFNF